MKIDTGGQAFPRPRHTETGYDDSSAQDGMTLRDWFAGQSLVGIIAHHGMSPMNVTVSQACYEQAEAMIAEREKGRE